MLGYSCIILFISTSLENNTFFGRVRSGMFIKSLLTYSYVLYYTPTGLSVATLLRVVGGGEWCMREGSFSYYRYLYARTLCVVWMKKENVF
jgi:hypothetical protein